MHPVFLLTDFGVSGHYHGVMKAVLASRSPQSPVHDLSHGVTPGKVREAAAVIEAAWPYLPARSVLCAVIDPGVGTARRALCVRVGERMAVGPDNGLLHPILTSWEGARAFHCVREDLALPEISSTFHGRDCFAPWAAHLAAGGRPEDLGPPVGDPVLLPGYEPRLEGAAVVGVIVMSDPFGNLISNIHRRHADAMRGEVHAEICGRRLGLVTTFGSVRIGEFLAYWGSSGHLEIAVRDGAASERLLAAAGTMLRLVPGPV